MQVEFQISRRLPMELAKLAVFVVVPLALADVVEPWVVVTLEEVCKGVDGTPAALVPLYVAVDCVTGVFTVLTVLLELEVLLELDAVHVGTASAWTPIQYWKGLRR